MAVKQLFAKKQQRVDDFLNEVIALTSVIHKNLVKLKGCCLRGDQRLLVCEFVENKNVSKALLGESILPFLESFHSMHLNRT